MTCQHPNTHETLTSYICEDCGLEHEIKDDGTEKLVYRNHENNANIVIRQNGFQPDPNPESRMWTVSWTNFIGRLEVEDFKTFEEVSRFVEELLAE